MAAQGASEAAQAHREVEAIVTRVLSEPRHAREAMLAGTDSQGLSPAHYAALAGSAACIRALARLGANISAKSKCRSTPLHAACAKGHDLAVRALLECGASASARDSLFRTPSSYAARNNFPALASLVESADCGSPSMAGISATATGRRHLRVRQRSSPLSCGFPPRPNTPSMSPAALAAAAATAEASAVPAFSLASSSMSTIGGTSAMASPSPAGMRASPAPVCSMASFRLDVPAVSRVSIDSIDAALATSSRKRPAESDDLSPAECSAKRPMMASSTSSWTMSSMASLAASSSHAAGCVAAEGESVGMDWF
ncbi:hypothetical protein FNF29_00528 [Cafeteria roenbergensis]|uniref:Uncharacterized protein n=2 Tax=Cafeteria roenbergensis TaxID=33653 RepID=A0A5A8CVV4_CAFRO|nr:hypothetical protein FNF29_00528 [Cafeteria roenbergensis]|eukprot:KAA0157176.1 hypothetical protein FNF29_00528 [Cafeteria roenbergensis]